MGPARTLLKEGKVMAQSPDDKMESEHLIYLFNDTLVIAAKKKENVITQVSSMFMEMKQYKLRAHVMLKECRLVQCADDPGNWRL